MRLKSFTAWTAAALVAASFLGTAIYAHDKGHEKKAWLGVMTPVTVTPIMAPKNNRSTGAPRRNWSVMNTDAVIRMDIQP